MGTVLIFWLFVLGIVCIPLQLTYRARGRVHDTIRAYLERGQEPPAALLAALVKAPPQLSYSPMNAAGAENLGVLILCLGGAVLGLGVVLSVVFWVQGAERALVAGPIVAAVGFMIGMIGLALLIIGRMRAKGGDGA